MTFEELGLSEKLLKALKDAGYDKPTPIQAKAIPPALEGKDVLGIAQTGTGKTAAFTLPMIERLSKGRARARMPRSLVLAPTRELAAQVAEAFKTHAANHKLTLALLIGGVAFGEQERVLNSGADVIIATPGRLLDLFERGKVMPAGVEVMVVDEADRMLDMGFIPDVERIFKLTPFTRQTLFFSATMPKEIQHLVDQFLQAPVRVEVAKPATAAENVTQRLIKLTSKTPKDKRAALRSAIDSREVKNAIVFCNRKRDVDVLARSLQRHGYSAAPIHGDLPQSQRTKTLGEFRSGDLKFLVASDVAARGLDIPEVSHVLNYDPPHSPDDYVHRIGRTGRAGKSGEAITISTPEDSKRLAAIETMLGGPIPPLEEGKGGQARDAGSGSESSDKPAPGKEASKPPARKAKDQPRQKQQPKQDDQPAKSGGKQASGSGRKRSSGKGGKDSKPSGKPEGFGDHVPAFIETSVRAHIGAS